MSFTVRDNPPKHRYEIVGELGSVLGFVEYVDHRGTRLLFHTEVSDDLEGQGVGSTLARGAIDQALDTGMPVEISCPFLKRWVERREEYADRVSFR